MADLGLHDAARRAAGLVLAPEQAEDRAHVDALIERAFGPGRFAKTAERLREGNSQSTDLSLVATEDGEVLGAVRLWPIAIGGRPALFLGPIAVERSARSRGIGAALVERAVAAAKGAQGLEAEAILLVGDGAFFRPLGFCDVPRGRVTLPGPVDQGRIFWLELKDGALESLNGAASLP